MKNRELITRLQLLPPDLEVLIVGEEDPLLIPSRAEVEPTCNEGETVIRLYTDAPDEAEEAEDPS